MSDRNQARRTTAEVVRVQAMEKPLTREKLYRFLGLA